MTHHRTRGLGPLAELTLGWLRDHPGTWSTTDLWRASQTANMEHIHEALRQLARDGLVEIVDLPRGQHPARWRLVDQGENTP